MLLMLLMWLMWFLPYLCAWRFFLGFFFEKINISMMDVDFIQALTLQGHPLLLFFFFFFFIFFFFFYFLI